MTDKLQLMCKRTFRSFFEH